METELRILHFGSYWNGENDIVNLMQRSLARLPGVQLVSFDPDLYGNTWARYIVRDGYVNWLADSLVKRLILSHSPDVIICNAGGLSPTYGMHNSLRKQAIRTIGIALSDPDDFARRSSRFAQYFELFFTNAKTSLELYRRMGVPIQLLPFGADTQYHRPLPEVAKKNDVVLIGGKRPERERLVAAIRKSGIRVKCYGRGWQSRLAKKIGLGSAVFGYEQVKAINSGKIYLSFPLTRAGYSNVKAGLFEAAACKSCILVEEFPEIFEYFEKDKEIVVYQNSLQAVEKIHELLADRSRRESIAQAAYDRVIRDHTWEKRWKHVLEQLRTSYGK